MDETMKGKPGPDGDETLEHTQVLFQRSRERRPQGADLQGLIIHYTGRSREESRALRGGADDRTPARGWSAAPTAHRGCRGAGPAGPRPWRCRVAGAMSSAGAGAAECP
jgi:hypothetical protein